MIGRIKKAVKDPLDAFMHAEKFIKGNVTVRLTGDYQTPNRERLIESDWGCLIVLDACRLDSFRKVNPWDGKCQQSVSQASNTSEWFRFNFLDIPEAVASEIAYVTANPQCQVPEEKQDWFGHFERVHGYAWDAEENTVLPSAVTDAGLRVDREHPEKRLVVHYLQPHGPLVGSDDPSVSDRYYQRLRTGEVTKEYVMECYKENLQLVLREVERFKNYYEGEMIVTADHGECFGETGLYAHPPNVRSKYLLEVPKIQLEGDGQDFPKTIKQLETGGETNVPVEERLAFLGYRG